MEGDTWIFGESAPSRRNKKTLCGECGLSVNTKEHMYLMNETWKEKNKLGLKKKMVVRLCRAFGHCKEDDGELSWSSGFKGDITQSDLAVMCRTYHRRKASDESETPKIEYCIYPENRSGLPGGVSVGVK